LPPGGPIFPESGVGAGARFTGGFVDELLDQQGWVLGGIPKGAVVV
jgi:hypothetical protein